MKPSYVLLFCVLLLAACAPSPSPVPQPTATKVARSRPTPTLAPRATDTPLEPSATDTPESTATPEFTTTPEPTPSATPKPLPLSADLPMLKLRDWPRPAQDNGWCMHFVATGYYDAGDLDREIRRLKQLHVKWALVLYADENHLQLAAQKFKEAEITVVWRKTLRPYEHYFAWGRDVEILKGKGLPPYFQLYNEPELPFEWQDQPEDKQLFFANLLQASKDLYNAGGYVGWQFLDEMWLKEFIEQVKAREGGRLFTRLFFVPHAYGVNHPPDYTQDANGVLGFRVFADVFQKEIGFVPPFVVGEGGWKLSDAETRLDARFPPIDEKLHAQYHAAVFDWFRIGKLSDGKPLPDYLFAFCPWMLSGSNEAGAWFDSLTGDRAQTIQAISAIPPFTREFSWDK